MAVGGCLKGSPSTSLCALMYWFVIHSAGGGEDLGQGVPRFSFWADETTNFLKLNYCH